MTKSKYDINLDGVLEEIGTFGRFQVRQYALMMLPVIFNALFKLSYVFTAGNLNYRCVIPGCDDFEQSITFNPVWLNNTVPFKDGIPIQCERFATISNESLERQYCDAADNFNRSVTVECSDFIYEDAEVTIVRDFGISCPENDWKLALVGTINNIGQFIALPIGGYISDRYGRRVILLLSVVGSVIFGVIRAYSVSYEMFLSMEFLDPVIGSTMSSTAFVLALELAGPRMRVIGAIIISCAFALGETLLGLLAMLFRNWRLLLKVMYFSSIVSLPLIWMTAESVRWLISKGYREKAFNLLQRAAQINGRSISLETFEKYCPIMESKEVSAESNEKSFFITMRHAFQNSGLVLRIIICSFCWLTNILVYYGLSLNSVSLAGDKYLNWILVCLIEIPGQLMLLLILDRVGRKRTLCTSMVLCGVFCFLSEFIESDNNWTNITLFLLSKLAITMSFSTLYIYTVEIFPTNLRQSLLSLCSMFGRIGSMVAPQTPLLAKLWSPLPMVVFGTMGIVSGLAILQFPETLNTQLPDTIEQAMNIKTVDEVNKDREA